MTVAEFITTACTPSFGELRLRRRRPTLRFNQNHDEHGKFAAGSTGSTSKFDASVAAFKAQGGAIHAVNGEEARVKMEEVDELASMIGIDTSTADSNPEGREAQGYAFTKFALDDAWMNDPEQLAKVEKQFGSMPTTEHVTFVAEGEGVGVAGAINGYVYKDDSGEALYVDYLGTLGTVEGTGSALTQRMAQFAAERNLPMVGNPTTDAAPWWENQVGWHDDPLEVGWDNEGLTAAETKALAG